MNLLKSAFYEALHYHRLPVLSDSAWLFVAIVAAMALVFHS